MAAVTEQEIHELGGQLRAAANAWAARDGSFDERAVTRLRRHAIACCHAHYRAGIPAYRRLCAEMDVGDTAPLEVLAERCTVTEELFKSYDAAWVGERDFAALSHWLRDVGAEAVPAGAATARDVDDWLDRLEAGGLHVLYSSGTSGKLSFVPRDEATRHAYRANGPSYLMHRVQGLGLDLSAMDGAVLGFRGGRMGIQQAGAELSRYLATVRYLYDWEIRAETLRTLLGPSLVGAPMPAGGTPMTVGQDQAYWRFLTALRRSSDAGRAVWLFGAPYQVHRLCALMQAVDAPPLRPGSVVTLGGGWKAFEGERIERSALGALIHKTLGVPAARVLEAYAMVELNTPLMRCPEDRYHVPPILEPWVFDEALLPQPPEEDVTGTFGFMDPTATSYPAFLATADRVRLVRAPCPCGLVGPAIVGEVRRTSGTEIRGCGGILATVRA